MGGRRWDGDDRGEGIADARPLAPGIEELVDLARQPKWVAEDPELHLLPHMRRACESLPLRLVDARAGDDGSFDVELGWTGESPRIGEVRAAVFSLVGSFAEVSTSVRQRRGQLDGDGDRIVFEVVTGIPEGGPFSPHGHTVRLRVTGLL